MRRLAGILLSTCVVWGCTGLGIAQEKSGTTISPPKVLAIAREFMKPGRAGAAHEKSESAFVQAMMHAQWPTHYLAVDAVSGKPRSLFLTGYDSFEAWEKDAKAEQKNATLSAAIDRAGFADGDLQSDADSTVLVYREDLSLRPDVDIPHMRYFDITLIHVKPGHSKDFEAIAKMYMAGWEGSPEVHWALYEATYGQVNDTYVVFSPLKSASEIDRNIASGKDFESKLGDDGMKKMSDLASAAIESTQSNLFIFNPRMSYVSPDWVKADPEFWTVKGSTGMAAAPKKMEKKAPTGGN